MILGQVTKISNNSVHVHISNYFNLFFKLFQIIVLNHVHNSQKGARHIWWWVRSSGELLWPNCPVQHVHKVFTDYFIFFNSTLTVRELGASEIKSMFTCNGDPKGDLIEWTQSKWAKEGEADFSPIRVTEFCAKPFSNDMVCSLEIAWFVDWKLHRMLIGNESTLFLLS